jgi:hypothetical protein
LGSRDRKPRRKWPTADRWDRTGVHRRVADPLRSVATVRYRGTHVQCSRVVLAFCKAMLLSNLISKLLGKSRAASVEGKFRESQDSYLEFLEIAERRATEVSPDYRLAWQNAFRLQHLLMKQQNLRFEYLLGNGQLDTQTARSISRIKERLDKGWADKEEESLKNSLPSYRDITRYRRNQIKMGSRYSK